MLNVPGCALMTLCKFKLSSSSMTIHTSRPLLALAPVTDAYLQCSTKKAVRVTVHVCCIAITA